MKALLITSGHTFSTLDVCTGLQYGLEANGVEVITYRLEQQIQTLNHFARGAVQAGYIPQEQAKQASNFATFLAGADAVTVALEHEVDAVFTVFGLLFATRRVLALRNLGIPVVCCGTEAPYLSEELDIAPLYTHWFTNERRSVAAFKQRGANAHYLQHAYNPLVHRPGPARAELASDAVFIGGFYDERKALFDGVDWTGIDFRGEGTLQTSDDPFNGVIPNDVTCDYYRSAKIVLNHHRTTGNWRRHEQIDPTAAESLGPRTYEVAACKAFQLCDDARPEIFEVFGETAATYRAGDSADLEKQVRYWLAHPDERERRRQAQHERVLPHHWGNRAKEILNVLDGWRGGASVFSTGQRWAVA